MAVLRSSAWKAPTEPSFERASRQAVSIEPPLQRQPDAPYPLHAAPLDVSQAPPGTLCRAHSYDRATVVVDDMTSERNVVTSRPLNADQNALESICSKRRSIGGRVPDQKFHWKMPKESSAPSLLPDVRPYRKPAVPSYG